MDDQQREAETLNTIYRLRHPVEQVIFDGAHPVRIRVADLAADREEPTGKWHLRRGTVVLADNLAGMTTAILALLAILDRESSDGPAR